jgi:hypothetical protein
MGSPVNDADWASQRVTPSLDRSVRVRKDTVSRKIRQLRRGALLLHLCGFYNAALWVLLPRLIGSGASYCHDRMLVQYLERPGHPRNCERSFIHSASCERNLQPAGLQREMWKVRPDDQDDHRGSCGGKAVFERVGGTLNTPPAAYRIRAAIRRLAEVRTYASLTRTTSEPIKRFIHGRRFFQNPTGEGGGL